VEEFVQQLQQKMRELGVGELRRLSALLSMDRDNRWERIDCVPALYTAKRR